ncbi:MAG: isoleucine--tRNA ligase [Candidatus Omnitrophica bacterium]|nr:isoleucine--tRNA ligase [Candidatus Omnitrophota bacterium]
MSEKKVEYKSTLNLPKTSFSMKANLPQREPDILKKWEELDIYKRIMEKYENAEKSFILHDGPPYANGHIHVGHVLNKTLKDICVKYYSMKGFRSPYIPGWDCHGLPVEHQLLKELKISKHEIDQVEFRKKAYKYAMKFVGIQTEEFKRLGVFGDFENPYLTLTKDYEANILFALAELYEKGYIYKDLKPVNWCKNCETALAEAEVEHEEKRSPSIFVKFAAEGTIKEKPSFFVIWTTTPWTLLANVAVALHPDFKYSFVSVGEEVWILASDLVENLMKKAGIKDFKILEEATGKEVSGRFKTAAHPFAGRESAIVLADYVTKEEGTGCVHTAPGHGQDDYVTGKKYGLPILMPVDDKGKFTAEAGEFAGQDVTAANKAIIDKMRSDGALIMAEEITHSYPHCWRCKDPIIFRATEQWFMNVDHNDLRSKMENVINNDVKWVPEAGKDRIGAMVKLRPDWCLSRQRYWGVPIPAFRCVSCGETFTCTSMIKKVAELTAEEGSNVWFRKTAEELLPAGTVCEKCGKGEFKKEDDILDVWFDSGVSYKAVLDERPELSFPADLYLEGSDQHRGWFQAALITSMGTKGSAPYREVLTHGFVVDGEGKKMSKSVGNVIKPQDVMKKYGADILRLWVASSDYECDIKLSSEILERLADGYRKIRNTFRFLLSNLYDFDPAKDALDVDDLNEIDRWMLSRLYTLTKNISEHYGNWEFHKVYRSVYDFCVYEVSSFYLDVLKDTLYIEKPDSPERRAHQTAMFRVLHTLCRVMAPIMSFTSEEIWDHMNYDPKEESVHLAAWPDAEKDMKGWGSKELDDKWEKILAIRERVMKFLEVKREEGLIGSSLEAAVELYPDDENMRRFIAKDIDLFPGLLKVSQVDLMEEPSRGMESVQGLPLKVSVKRAKGRKCQRCWNFVETVGKNKEALDICVRCYDIISERSDNGQ